MTRIALIAATMFLTGLAAPPAHATQAEFCVRHIRLEFSPPLTMARAAGTVVRRQTAVCARANSTIFVPETVSFTGASSGTYVGSCLHAEVAGEFSMTIVGGGGGVLYATYPHYIVADAFVLVPDQACNVSSATGIETGPGLWP